MSRLTSLALLMAALWAAFFMLSWALTVALTGHGPISLLSALYVAATGLLAASWAAGVATPAGVRT